jgi:hypothetical protein
MWRVLERLAAYDEGKGRRSSPSSFRTRAAETREHADHLRQFLLTLNQQ